MREAVRLTISLQPLYLVFACMCAASQCCADAKPGGLQQGAGAPNLAISTTTAQTGVFVSQANARSYRDVLPEPLFELVSKGEWGFVAVKSLLHPEQFVVHQSSAHSAVQVSHSGELSPIPVQVKGALFRLHPEALKRSDPTDIAVTGYKALWNAVVSTWRYPYIKANASLSIFRNAVSGVRRVQWAVERIYPAALGKYPGTLTPFFREKISAEQPAVLDGLRWLTIRSMGGIEDYVWAGSPLSGHVRQMTGSNRADEVFAGAFSPDDLFVWSGKVEMVKPTAVSYPTLLVPFIEQALSKESANGSCTHRTATGGTAVEINHRTNRYADIPGWVPTNVVMVPRRMVQVDFSSFDPLAPEATTTLLIDEESHVPVYKIVWGRDARLRYFVVGIMGSVSESGVFLPLSLGQILVRSTVGDHSVVSLDKFLTCDGFPEGVSFSRFDPTSLQSSPLSKKENLPSKALPEHESEEEVNND